MADSICIWTVEKVGKNFYYPIRNTFNTYWFSLSIATSEDFQIPNTCTELSQFSELTASIVCNAPLWYLHNKKATHNSDIAHL